MNLSPQMEEHTIEVGGRKVFYTARGPQDARFAYVGINGLMGGGDSFWPVIQGVPDTWRIVLPDLPGCGGSETIPPPHRHDIQGYSRWLGQFLAEVGLSDKKLVLASVATGAPISIRYSWENADRVAGQVFHLPFLGRVAISAKWARPIVGYGLKLEPLRKLVDGLRASDQVMHKIILHEPPDAIPELAERDIDHKQQADLVAAGELLHDLMLNDSRAELRHVRTPILVLASEHDFSAPLSVMQWLERTGPDRRLYVYHGGQHSWNEEFIDDMNREIRDFLGMVESKQQSPSDQA